MRRQPLLTDTLRRRFADLGPQDHGDEAREVVVAHFFLPGTGWDWWAIAYDEDGGAAQLFCLVRGLEVELGYVALADLEGARSPLGVGVERDEDWRECSLAELRRQLGPQTIRHPFGPGFAAIFVGRGRNCWHRSLEHDGRDREPEQ